MRGDGARTARATWGLLALALALRVAWALLASTELRLDHVFNDATARSLAAGRGFTASFEEPLHPAIFRTPGYSVLVAAVYAVVGPSVRAVFLVQALLDTLTCGLIAGLARRRLGTRAGLIALLLAATYPFTVHAVGVLSAETTIVLLATLLVVGIDRLADDAPRARTAALCVLVGALVGVAAWVKPVVLPLPAVLFVAEWWRTRDARRALRRAVAVGVVAAAVFAPWVVRNVRAFGEPILAAELGLVVFHGTYDFADQRDAMIAQGFVDEAASVPASAPPAADGLSARYHATRRALADSDRVIARDREFLELGLARLRAAPLRCLVLDPLRRIPRLWVSTTYVGGPAWIGSGAAAACIGYLLLAAAGAWRLRASLSARAAWFVVPVTLTLAYAALHVEARYTLPARPTLLLLGAAALVPIGARGGRSGHAPGNAAFPGAGPDTIAP